jgi:hypothetical protein
MRDDVVVALALLTVTIGLTFIMLYEDGRLRERIIKLETA